MKPQLLFLSMHLSTFIKQFGPNRKCLENIQERKNESTKIFSLCIFKNSPNSERKVNRSELFSVNQEDFLYQRFMKKFSSYFFNWIWIFIKAKKKKNEMIINWKSKEYVPPKIEFERLFRCINIIAKIKNLKIWRINHSQPLLPTEKISELI